MQPGELAHAHRLLLIPDLLHSWLCGALVSERTNATTTQCWDAEASAWAMDLLEQLALPTALLPPVVEAGTVLGNVLPTLHSELGQARVIAPATHDTGSAIVSAPVTSAYGWGYISSGTWSLVGVELQRPLLTAEARAANFTNEGGIFGTTRFLKNVMGLWMLQECQRQWMHEVRVMDYDTLFPAVGMATRRLLERLGHTVDFPEAQTCCGQMHFNTGYQRESIPLLCHFVEVFGEAESTTHGGKNSRPTRN